MLGAVLGFTPYAHRSCMKFGKFYVTWTQIWCKLWSNLLHLFNNIWNHTMDMLWEKFQWILPLYMKPISFQSKASVVCSVTAAVFIDFCLKKLNVFSQQIGQKTNEYLNSTELISRNWNVDQLNYLMMQHQPIVKRVNGTHEWAHRPYQSLSAPYHCCLYKHRRLDERQPPQTSWPVPICT